MELYFPKIGHKSKCKQNLQEQTQIDVTSKFCNFGNQAQLGATQHGRTEYITSGRDIQSTGGYMGLFFWGCSFIIILNLTMSKFYS